VKKKELFTLCALGLALLGSFATAYAQNNNKPDYQLLTTISNIPGNLAGVFDISWVDSETGRYYLTTRAVPPVAPKPSVTVIDTENDTYLFSIPLPTSGNGVVAIHRVGDNDQGNGSGLLVVGGSDSTAIFIDLAHPFAPPIAVPTNRTTPPLVGVVNGRADELAYDPADHIILIANDRATPDPFVSFISVGTNPQKVGEIVYDGTLGNPKSTGGIEQPVWNTVTRKFYIAIPSTALHPKGEVDEIDPITKKITNFIATSCNPAGLALIPGQRLMTSCGDVLDIASRTVVHTVPGVSADEIWYNPGDERVYFGGFFSVAVVSGVEPYNVIATLPWTGHFTPPPAQFSHSIAADSQNNHVYLPVTNLGVLVFTDDNGQGPQ
jgi:hypothetical protein